MDWTQAFTIIGVLGSFMVWLHNKSDAELKIQNQRLEMFSQRLDQLYQMYIDLLKEKKNG